MRERKSSIVNALLRVLRLEEAKHPDTQTHFTRHLLFALLRTTNPDYYGQLRSLLHGWCLSAANHGVDAVLAEVRRHMPAFLGAIPAAWDVSKEFVGGKAEQAEAKAGAPAANVVNYHDFDIRIASVHAVKGQTHTTTLYFETAFGKDGQGPNAKSYESQRLAPQFLGIRLAGDEAKRVQQSARMAYVGFSRPTHLLCLAVHRDRFESNLKEAAEHGWTIEAVE
jgi:hypothetical protein